MDAKADSSQVFEVLDEMKKSITLIGSKVDQDAESLLNVNEFVSKQ